jgi:hypothetical protein
MGYGNDFLNERMDYIDELFNARDNDLDRIDGLLLTSSIQYELREEIYREMKGHVDQERADELIEFLYRNQVDPISAGANYGQSDIVNKLNKEL